ncbi:MAG: serine/threonine protein kinase [Polyangiaceae bacterium]|jgi:serine/threonine-protein kinase|nr:serine/threonine protein kinase [Polyangiaceae bacterium]
MIEPGSRLDRYECLHPIGKGGMASVWVARMVGKHGFEKLVAIKTMLPEHARDAGFLKMLLDEAHIVSGIRHPNVASILDLGEQDGLFYLVFEWVEGERLSKLCRVLKRTGDSIPLGLALRIVADTCAGLHAAHELCDAAGWPLYVVHRDVSPQNIMLSVSGGVKVIDFGIAKAMDRIAEDTEAGKLKGKSTYMAPEIVQAKEIDRRADIWAAGVVLHELVTNRPPLRATKGSDLLRMLATNQEPEPLPADLAPPVASVLTKALRPKREERYQTAAEMQRDLEQAIVTFEGAVTAADVAVYAQKHLGDLIEAKRVAVAAALDRLATRSTSSDKHRAAREVIATLPSARAPDDKSRTCPARDGPCLSVASGGSLSVQTMVLRASDATESAPATPTAQAPPASQRWLSSHPTLASAAAAAGLVALVSLLIVGGARRTPVEPARHVPLGAPTGLLETVAERAAAAAQSVQPIQSVQPPASATVRASAKAPRPAKASPRRKRKDPLSVFGTR